MKISSLTDIGVKRTDNQDNYWAALLDVDGEQAGVICLCDGMGGLANGRRASKIVVSHVKDFFMEDYDFDNLEKLLVDANKEVYNIGREQDNSMGTTCTILFCYKGKYNIMHIGDSRAYIIRDGECNAITEDHSAIRMYNVTKQNNPKLYAKYKNMLTRCIGVKPEIKVDTFSGDYKEGDKFFLCSDGLWHYFDENTFSLDLLEDLPRLINNCISSGETDNITIGVLSI